MIYIEDLDILYNFLKEYSFIYDNKLDIWYKDYIIYLDKNNKSKTSIIVDIKNDKCVYFQSSKKYGKFNVYDIFNTKQILTYMNLLNSFSRYNKIKKILINND